MTNWRIGNRSSDFIFLQTFAYQGQLLNVQDCVQAIVVAAGGDRSLPVFGRLNDIGVESYEVEEGMSKMKGGKALGLDQCSV